MLGSYSPENTNLKQDDSPQSMNNSSLNPMRFLHRLVYSNRNRNSTYKSKSSLNSVRFNHDLIYSDDAAFKNSTVKARYGRNYGLNLTSKAYSSNSRSSEITPILKTSTPQFQTTGSTDLNNNDLEYSDDDEEVRVTYSYLKDCAIYGVPYEGREKTFDKLARWWLYSSLYDSKSFIIKEWKTILILIVLYIFVQLVYCCF